MEIQKKEDKFKKQLHTSSGFTLIEMVISLVIMTILIAIAVPVSFRFYTTSINVAERNLVLSLVREARNQAMTNVNGSDHGFKVASDSYILFEGSSFATRDSALDISFGRSSLITVSGSDEIVFFKFSGRSSSASFNMIGNSKSQLITVNYEGGVDW